MDFVQLFTLFGAGLLAGGITCMAVQGGLLATVIAQREQEEIKDKNEVSSATRRKHIVLSLSSFLLAKLIAYTILGLLLGWFGSLFQISIHIQIVLYLLLGIYMLGIAGNILQLHPIFRYASLQPPYRISKFIRNKTKSKSIFGPALLGALTVFIPCGTTQAVMAMSIASGDPIYGALLLFSFTLGTIPLFFLFGYMTHLLGERMRMAFANFAAILVIIFAILTLNNALALTGTKYTLEGITKSAWCVLSYCEENFENIPITNTVDLTILDDGYTPNIFAVRAGEIVTLNLINRGGKGCTQAFTIPALGVQKIVPYGQNATLTFTAPVEKGDMYFMCSQGMYRGTIRVL